MSNFTKRIYISLCSGLAIPYGYLLVLIVLDAIFRVRPARAWRWLLFPLTSFGAEYRSVVHPGVEDLWGVPLDVILFMFVANVIFYGSICFLVLSARAAWKRQDTSTI